MNIDFLSKSGRYKINHSYVENHIKFGICSGPVTSFADAKWKMYLLGHSKNIFDKSVATNYVDCSKMHTLNSKISLRLIGSAIFCVTFNLVSYTCRSAVIFGTLKDDDRWNSILASNKCFSHRNVFQNGVNTMSKIVNHFFVKKAQNFVWFRPYDFVQISQTCGPNTYQIIYIETFDFQCQHQQW